MRILKATNKNIRLAAETIKKGGLVVYPTDTVYGLGCNPFNVNSVRKVFEVKGRTRKPLPVLAYSIKDVEKVAEVTESTVKIARKFWPGPLTLILPRKPKLPGVVTCNLNSVGVRIPGHKIALELIRVSNGLLIGTSANKTGEEPPRTPLEAAQQIGDKVDIIIDGGPTPLGKSSTVVDLTKEKPILVREGPIDLDAVLKALKA